MFWNKNLSGSLGLLTGPTESEIDLAWRDVKVYPVPSPLPWAGNRPLEQAAPRPSMPYYHLHYRYEYSCYSCRYSAGKKHNTGANKIKSFGCCPSIPAEKNNFSLFLPSLGMKKREENSHSLLESAISKVHYWDKKMQQNNNLTKVKIFKCLTSMEPLISL